MEINKITTFLSAFLFAMSTFLTAHADNIVAPSTSCVQISKNLSLGLSGNEVTKLQLYLSQTGYFSVAPSGYFGQVTMGAVRNFQRDHGITILGSVGPLTRAEIARVSCGTVTALTPHIDSITPTKGSSGTVVTILGSGFANSNIIKFGSGGINTSMVTANGTQITFTIPKFIGNYCAPNMFCSMLARQVSPGDYDVSIKNDDTPESNSKIFTVTSDTSNGPQIIGTDAPNGLKVGQSGSWTIHMAAQAIGTYNYSVVWGDEVYNPSAAAATQSSTQFQSTTFTHAYSSPGTYTPRFVVTNSGGASASVTSTVVVTNN
ncbi:MAG: Cell wall lytic [Candidatus Taylorbacteria bacterium]|nr:Cell wall lytic [Candidatus Taylorbacteria bacterium]